MAAKQMEEIQRKLALLAYPRAKAPAQSLLLFAGVEVLRLIVDLVEASCYADNPEWRPDIAELELKLSEYTKKMSNHKGMLYDYNPNEDYAETELKLRKYLQSILETVKSFNMIYTKEIQPWTHMMEVPQFHGLVQLLITCHMNTLYDCSTHIEIRWWRHIGYGFVFSYIGLCSAVLSATGGLRIQNPKMSTGLLCCPKFVRAMNQGNVSGRMLVVLLLLLGLLHTKNLVGSLRDSDAANYI